MALRSDPYGNFYCSECSGKLDPYLPSGSLIATLFAGEMVTWMLTAVFVGLGMVWTPAYLVAGCLAAVGMFRMGSRQQRFVCLRCKREYTHEQVHGH